VRIRQEPEPQVAVAFARVHGVPHEPQSESVVVGVSQPFPSSPSQVA
jgi:hypothetical protein